MLLVEFRPKDFSVIWWVRRPARKLRTGGLMEITAGERLSFWAASKRIWWLELINWGMDELYRAGTILI